MSKDFKSLLSPKFISFLEHKLEAGEMTPEECKEILKEMMLREYEKGQAESTQVNWKIRAAWFHEKINSLRKKIFERQPAESSIGMEELAGTMRSRRL